MCMSVHAHVTRTHTHTVLCCVYAYICAFVLERAYVRI